MKPSAPLLSDLLLSGLSEIVAARLGLHFPPARWRDMERGILAAAPELGLPDAASCAQWLLRSSLTQRHIEILASHLTVGETYFFREEAAFEILETRLLPELLHARRQQRHLRIWSVGCCTGEEPYSIAMLLDKLIPDYDAWNITLLATDINPNFLRKAAVGVYGEWSFRNAPNWLKHRYFKQRKDGQFELAAHIKRRVHFTYLNLAEDIYPSLLNNTSAMDVIFCRNVLMYFTPARVEKVVANLHQALINGGWLIVNPTETSNTLFPLYTPIAFPGGTFYQKISSGTPAKVTAIPASVFEQGLPSRSPPILPSLSPLEIPPQAIVSTSLSQRPLTASMENQAYGHFTHRARACANQGQLAEAVEWCQKAIAADKMNVAGHYLLATVLQEQHQIEAAIQALNAALYLDPKFALASFTLGNLCLSQGRQREAERHFKYVAALLKTQKPDAILAEAEGLTAGRLLEIVSTILLSLTNIATAHI